MQSPNISNLDNIKGTSNGLNDKVIYFYDQNSGKYEYMSKGIKNLTGYTLKDINDIGFKKIVKKVLCKRNNSYEITGNEGDREIVEEFFGKYLIETKKGELKWFEDNSFTQFDKTGMRKNSIGILRDVTESHESFQQLQEEKSKLNSILDLAEVIFIMVDGQDRITLINNKGCKEFGYTKKEIIGKNWGVLFHDKELIDKYRNIFNPQPKEIEIPILDHSGEPRIINWHKTVLWDDKGNIASIVISGQDITEKKKEENIQKVISQILQAAHSVINLEELFKFIHVSIAGLMPADNFYIALYNKETNFITFPYFIDKYEEEAPPQPFGKGLTEYVLKTGKPFLVDKKKDDELVAKGEAEIVGTQSAIWLGVPLKIQGNTIGVMAVQDYEEKSTYTEKEKEILEAISYPISMAIERKRVEQEREKLIEELKELNLSKDNLFSLISHDLRSPFNSLLGFSEILTTEYDTLTSEEIKEYLKVIYESSKNLYGMTNNLLQFSRFQMGRIEFNPEKLNLEKLINKNVDILMGNIIKKQLTVITNVDADTFVLADEDMLNSIIQNLISNTIKFTNKGGDIKISAKVFPAQEGTENVEIRIEDTGIGISEKNLDKILHNQMFSTPGTEREYGTGLGLLIVKEFMEKNGGKIKIESKLHRGTVFICYLPSA
jgi:PAS domain S-box-containing protein